MNKAALFLVFLPFFCAAQKKDTVLKYLDANLQFTSRSKAVFYAVAVQTERDWYVYALYPDTTPLLKAHFKERALKTRQGPYHSFYPKHKMAYSGFYENNKKTGVWQSWYESGQLKDSGAFMNDLMTGYWRHWHDNGTLAAEKRYSTTFLSEEMKRLLFTNELTVASKREGLFVTWYPDGTKESEGRYENDLMEGRWEWFHENGSPSTLEMYRQGRLTDLQCFDTEGKETGNLCSINRPATLKEWGDLRSYLLERLEWPEEAIQKKIEGTVTVSFVVSKEGKLEHLQVTGISDVLKNATTEFFRALPDWEPAISHNRLVEWKESIEIPFYFNKD